MSKAVSLSGVFDKIGYVPHSGQRRLHAAKGTHRFRVCCAGRRTGKSTSGGHELTAHAYEAYLRQEELDPQGKRMEYWIVGPEYSDSEKEFRVLYGDLKKRGFVFDHPGTYYDAVGGNMHISLFGGKFQVHAKSAKYPDQLVGEGLHGVILAEAAKLRPSIWPKYLRPMLVDYRGWALMTSTPEGKNWFYDAWMNQMRGYGEWWSIRMPSWTNDYLFPLGKNDPEFASLGEGLTDEAFKQEIGAEFTEFVGRVFKNFDEEIHCRPLQYDPSLFTTAAVDYGFTNPMVWLLIQVDYWENVYVIGEFYEPHWRVDEAAMEIKARGLCPPSVRTFYPDPASPSDSAILEGKLRIKAEGGTQSELHERLRLIRKWIDIDPKLQHLPFGHPERQPKIFIDSVKCPKTVFELSNYRYPSKRTQVQKDANNTENPLKKDDHTPEALGRFFLGYFGGKDKDSGRTRIGRSTISTGHESNTIKGSYKGVPARLIPR